MMKFTLINQYNPKQNKYSIIHLPILDRYVIAIYSKNILDKSKTDLVGYFSNNDQTLGYASYEEAKMFCDLSGMTELNSNTISEMKIVRTQDEQKIPYDAPRSLRYKKLEFDTIKILTDYEPKNVVIEEEDQSNDIPVVIEEVKEKEPVLFDDLLDDLIKMME